MVGRAVGSDKPRPVKHHHHMQVLQGDVVHDLVVGALHEARINRDHRHHAVAGKARGKRERMFFGNAHVNHAIR